MKFLGRPAPTADAAASRKTRVSVDGRFVTTLADDDEGASNRIFVVLNWHTELVERMRYSASAGKLRESR